MNIKVKNKTNIPSLEVTFTIPFIISIWLLSLFQISNHPIMNSLKKDEEVLVAFLSGVNQVDSEN